MKFLFMVALCCFFSSGIASKSYQINKIESSPGIYFDYMGKVVFSDEQWKLITYVDTRKFEQEVATLRKSYTILEKLCSIRTCPMFKRMDFLYRTTSDKASTFYQMVDSSADNVPHVITGAANQDRALRIDEMINKYEQNENSQEHYKDYVSINKGALSYYNYTQDKFENLEKYYNKNVQYYNDADNQAEQIKTDPEIGKSIDEHLQAVSLACLDVDKEFTSLLDSVYYSQKNVIHPDMLTSMNFVKELTKTEKHITTPHKYPYPLNTENSHNLLNLVEMNVFYVNKKLILSAAVPLVRDTVFDLYNTLPMPVQGHEDAFMYVQPSANFLALSENKKEYATYDVMRYCRKLTGITTMCRYETVHSAVSRPICETELLLGKSSIPQSCYTKVTKNELDIWQKLQYKNEWVFVKAEPEDVTVECQNQQPETVKVSKSGVLALDSSCLVKTKSTTFEAKGPSYRLHGDANPTANILADSCCTEENVRKTLTNAEPSVWKVSNINLNNLHTVSYKIEEGQRPHAHRH